MTRLLTMLVLMLASSSAMAEWIKIIDAHENDTDITLYADLSELRKNGDTVRMWTMNNFSKPQKNSGVETLSTKQLGEYDCKAEKSRMLAFTWFSKNMADGDVVLATGVPGDWAAFEPGSLADYSWQLACGKI